MTATLAHQMTRDVPPSGDPGSWICSQMGEGGFSIQAQNPPAALWLVPNETSRGQVSTLRAAILPRLSAVRPCPPGRSRPESHPATHATLEPKPCFVSACHRSPITTVARDSRLRRQDRQHRGRRTADPPPHRHAVLRNPRTFSGNGLKHNLGTHQDPSKLAHLSGLAWFTTPNWPIQASIIARLLPDRHADPVTASSDVQYKSDENICRWSHEAWRIITTRARIASGQRR